MEKGLANAKVRGFAQSFSAYIAWLIERDSDGGVVREDSPGWGSKRGGPAAGGKAKKAGQ